MAWRIVTPGLKMGRHWVYAEHASIGSESDEHDDPYRQALAELAIRAIDVDQAAERLRGIRSPQLNRRAALSAARPPRGAGLRPRHSPNSSKDRHAVTLTDKGRLTP
jgi:hypothetical protein